MKVKGLYKFIKDHCPRAVTEHKMHEFRGKIIAIDASIAIYQLCSVGAKYNIKNKDGKPIHHIQGLFFKVAAMIELGIIPIYVFDGAPPPEKGPILKKRKEVIGRTHITGDIFAECKKLLRLMGITCIDAPSEAEAQAAAFTQHGVAYAMASEDADSLLFGARILLRHFAADSVIIQYDLNDILFDLGLNMDQFVSMCILAGTDYNDAMMNIKDAYDTIKDGQVIENDKFVHLKNLFLKPEVETLILDNIMSTASINIDKLRKYLIDSHGLDVKRVDNALEKIKKL